MDRLFWDSFMITADDFATFIDKTSSFLHIYLGDLREAVAHSDKINRYGRVIYNQSAWDLDKFKEIKEDITRPNHYEVIKEVILRIEKYGCTKIDLGFLGRWKNPYMLADMPMKTTITVTYEKREDHFFMRITLFTPEQWFKLQCKPLFRTDPIVAKDPRGSWNMNPNGLIAAKNEKTAANRRAVFNMVGDFVKDFMPKFTAIGLCAFYYNLQTNHGYLVDPEAKNNEELLPLMFYMDDYRGKILYSDSTDIPIKNYSSSQVKDNRIYFDKKHFDFF